MKISRRSFIKVSSAATLTAFVPAFLQGSPPSKEIGLQLYTVRDKIKTDLADLIKQIASIGYNYLEAAGYSNRKFYGKRPAEFRKIINDNGLKMISSHASFLLEDADKAIEDHAELGVQYIVFPSFLVKKEDTGEIYVEFAEILNRIGDKCRQAGIKLGYHNHQFEYLDYNGIAGYDILLQNTDPDLVVFEMDLCWTIAAGQDPIKYFKKYPGRFELWHVKDMKPGIEEHLTEVGTGIIDFQRIFKKQKKAGELIILRPLSLIIFLNSAGLFP